MTTPFVGLHIHSDFSFLDGASQLSQMVDRVAELGMDAIALTDHGVMHGAIELIKLCRGKNIKPIIGNEMYVINGDIEDKTVKCRKYHQVVLALNKQGYQNLVKLTTISHLKGFMGKGIFARPCINKPLLEKYNEGLLVTSACLGGEIPQAILAGKREHAYDVARWYKRVFGDRFYLEIQDHGQVEERIVNPVLVQMGKDLGIELVATNDSHYISCYDVEAHDALLCIQTGKLVSDENRMRYTGTEYLKTGDEMMMLFRDHLEKDVVERAVANTVAIANRVTDNYDLFAEPTEPTFPLPEGETPDSYLREWAEDGLKERLVKIPNELHEKYWNQLEYEINLLSQKGLCQYFLIVGDKIRWARSQGIPVGAGRGSAAGSVVAYAMKITNIDPIHHGLLFERFINPERASYPDIDTDFCVKRRGEVIQYLVEKYGSDRVAQIITFNRLTSKAVIKDSGRVLDYPYGEVDKITKEIPVVRGKPAKLKLMISNESPVVEFKRRYEKEQDFTNLINLSIRLEGVHKTSGVHAAGVVISAEPLDTKVPLMMAKDGSVITQYPMEDLESLGLIKIDILGLKNLTTVDRACKLIEKNRGERLDIDEFPVDDEATYQLYQSGRVNGIFQVDSSGMRSVLRELRPTNIEDISSILALYRPGPLDSGMIPKFIDRKHGREPVVYDAPILEGILKHSYGLMIYQEGILKIAQLLGGFSLGKADLLRRCLSGDTIVALADGSRISLQEMSKQPFKWINQEVQCLDTRTLKHSVAKITNFFNNGKQEVWRIKTKTGRSIKATSTHQFLCLKGWKSMDEGLSVGNEIAVPVKLLPHRRGDTGLSIELIRLCAYMIGDGYLPKKWSNSYFCNTEEPMLRDFIECFHKEFGVKLEVDYQQAEHQPKPVGYVRFTNRKVFEAVNMFWRLITPGKSGDRFVPDWVWDLDGEGLKNFIACLWSTDGCFMKQQERGAYLGEYCSKSEKLAYGVQECLLRLGIVSTVNKKNGTYKGQPYPSYRVWISGKKDVVDFHRVLNTYLSPAKQEQVCLAKTRMQESLDNFSKYNIPSDVIESIRDVKYESKMTWSEIDAAVGVKRGTMSSGLNFSNPGTRKLARHRVKNFAIAFNNQYLHSLADADILWDEITSIEYAGVEDVFDITVEGLHNFVANGIYAHNCLGKKKPEEVKKYKADFVNGCASNGYPEELAEKLWIDIENACEYSFNKSHSASYADLSFKTCYLKAHYTVEYIAALLTDDSGDKDKVAKHIADASSFKIGILPPDVNKSDMEFTPDGENIRFGLSAIANVGDGIIESILQARAEKPFDSFQDFCYRVKKLNSKLNKKTVESLIYSGAFDSIHSNRAELINNMENVLGWAGGITKSKEQDDATGQMSLFDALDVEEPIIDLTIPILKHCHDFPLDEKLQLEKQFLQFYASGHPLQNAKSVADVYGVTAIAEINEKEEIEGVEYWAHPNDKLVRVVALLSELKPIITKKGEPMAIIDSMEDLSGSCKAVVFPKTYKDIKGLIKVGQRLLIYGKLGVNNEERQIIVDHAVSLSETKMLLINLTPQQAQGRQLAMLENIMRPYQQAGVFTTPVVSQLFGRQVRFHPKFWVVRPEEVTRELRKEGFDAHVVKLSGEQDSEQPINTLAAA